ncbi:MAG: TetR/AcrR family transcriptional regulator [Bacteroidia bacterium]
MKRKIKVVDSTTEEKIKEAARRLFTQKGFEAVKTRDIAAEAGINLALLNYYFRSKQKLFDVIMMENVRQFVQGVAVILSDVDVPLYAKMEKLVGHYIDMLCATPDLAFFIFNQMRIAGHNDGITIPPEILAAREMMQKQISAEMAAGRIAKVDPLHLMANLLGLVVFPFIASPLLKARRNITDKKFMELMQERKKLIPIWISAMLKPG